MYTYNIAPEGNQPQVIFSNLGSSSTFTANKATITLFHDEDFMSPEEVRKIHVRAQWNLIKHTIDEHIGMTAPFPIKGSNTIFVELADVLKAAHYKVIIGNPIMLQYKPPMPDNPIPVPVTTILV